MAGTSDATKVVLAVAIGLTMIAMTGLLGIIWLVSKYDLRDTVVIAIVGISSGAVGGLSGLCIGLRVPGGSGDRPAPGEEPAA